MEQTFGAGLMTAAGDERAQARHFHKGLRIFPSVVRLESFSLREVLSAVPLPMLALGPSGDSGYLLGVRALTARRRVPSLGASSGPPFTLSCRWDTVRVRPGALATGGESVLMHRDEEATVFRAKLGRWGGARGALGVGGGGLGSSSGLWGPWELERQILFSSDFCLGTLRRGLALGFLRDPLCCSGGSFPGRVLPEPTLARGLGSSVTAATAPAPFEDLLGDVSEVPLMEPWRGRDHGASAPLGGSRGDCLEPVEPLLALEIGTTLRMLALSEDVKVRTGLGAAPWLRGTVSMLGAPWDASLREFLFGAIPSFSLAGLSSERPPLQLGPLFSEAGAEASPGGLDTGLEDTWLPPLSPAPEDTEPSPSPLSPGSPPPGLESVPSE